MAKRSTFTKLSKKQKYPTREKNFCPLTGRTRGYMRRFGMSRILFRELANTGQIPGVKKVSW